MTYPRTIHPFAGCPVLFTFDQHVQAGLMGGTDYRVVPKIGFPIIAAAAGVVSRISSTQACLTVSPTLRYNYRELRSYSTGGVTIGQRFGESGRLTPNGGVYGPHIDAERLINGKWVREPFEPHVNSSLGGTAGEGGTPIEETTKRNPMFRAVIASTTRVFYFDSLSFTEVVAGSARDNALARFVGISALTITLAELAEYQGWVANNIAALPVGSGGGLTPAQDAKLMAIPSADADTVDEGELAQAETSGTALTLTGVQTKLDAAVLAINNHTTSKFDGLTLTTP